MSTTFDPQDAKLIANRYLLKDLLGDGGFCEVFLADDLHFDPPKAVAIKLLRAEFLNDPAARADIRREASALAQFDHPNILPIREFDTSAEQAYVVMKLIEGGSLAQKIEADPTPPPSLIEVAEYLSQICEAIDQVHEKDLIHCDLKPANILLDKDELGNATVPVIADFGQVVSHTSQTSFTEKSDVIGTMKYMSPEQWGGHVGKASDIYAIGIITYELITGQPPFQGNSKEELKNQHATGRRPKLKERAPHLTYPPALDQLFEEVLDRDPQRRNDTFPTATHFYNRFEETIIKSPVVTPSPATTSVQPATGTFDTPPQVKIFSNTQPSSSWPVNPSTANHPFQVTAGLVQVIQSPGLTKLKPRKKKNPFLILNLIIVGCIIALAATFILFTAVKNNTPAVGPFKTLANGRYTVYSVAFSSDGKTLVSGSGNDTIKLWDMASGKLSSILSLDDKDSDFDTSDGVIQLWYMASSKVYMLTSLLNDPQEGAIGPLSTKGKTLVSVSGDTVNLLDSTSGNLLTSITGHIEGGQGSAFSPDGKTLAFGSEDGPITVWDLASNTRSNHLLGHSNQITSVAFSPDGKTLASGSFDKTVKLWDVPSGKLLTSLSGHSDDIYIVAFSPDGKTLASGSWDKTVKLWDVASGKLLTTLSGHSGAVSAITFSPDGRTLASGSYDKTIKLWDVSTGKLLTTFAGHADLITSVAFSPDGSTLASGSFDQTIKLWQVKGESLDEKNALK